MRIMIFGGSGMLGHKLWQTLANRQDVYATLRPAPPARVRGLFDEARTLSGVFAEDFESVARAFETVSPDVVINCVGIVKQDAAATDPVKSITVNALFPHRLAQLCAKGGARMIHLSTDCVFSGRKGNYSERDTPDCEDLYGRSKLLGEATGENCFTMRTSMIGRELAGSHGLIEWFLSQKGKRVRGFTKAIFSGYTTSALASVIAEVVEGHPHLNGLWHVAAEPVNKFDLLSLVKQAYEVEVEIEPDDSFICDRSLDGSSFHEKTGIRAPAWPEMIEQMAHDATPYEEIRRN